MALSSIPVRGIRCASCENTIRTALGRLEGVRAVRPRADSNEVRINYDEAKINEKQLRAALAELGYGPAA